VLLIACAASAIATTCAICLAGIPPAQEGALVVQISKRTDSETVEPAICLSVAPIDQLLRFVQMEGLYVLSTCEQNAA
jgi:hypothetical protein